MSPDSWGVNQGSTVFSEVAAMLTRRASDHWVV